MPVVTLRFNRANIGIASTTPWRITTYGYVASLVKATAFDPPVAPTGSGQTTLSVQPEVGGGAAWLGTFTTVLSNALLSAQSDYAISPDPPPTGNPLTFTADITWASGDALHGRQMPAFFNSAPSWSYSAVIQVHYCVFDTQLTIRNDEEYEFHALARAVNYPDALTVTNAATLIEFDINGTVIGVVPTFSHIDGSNYHYYRASTPWSGLLHSTDVVRVRAHYDLGIVSPWATMPLVEPPDVYQSISLLCDRRVGSTHIAYKQASTTNVRCLTQLKIQAPAVSGSDPLISSNDKPGELLLYDGTFYQITDSCQLYQSQTHDADNWSFIMSLAASSKLLGVRKSPDGSTLYLMTLNASNVPWRYVIINTGSGWAVEDSGAVSGLPAGLKRPSALEYDGNEFELIYTTSAGALEMATSGNELANWAVAI